MFSLKTVWLVFINITSSTKLLISYEVGGFLVIMKRQGGLVMQCKSLEEVRSNIDRIDNEIIKLIAERGTYVVQASNFKKDEEG